MDPAFDGLVARLRAHAVRLRDEIGRDDTPPNDLRAWLEDTLMQEAANDVRKLGAPELRRMLRQLRTNVLAIVNGTLAPAVKP
jgi:hypothetical protein